jgi:hypothetical protein
MPSFALPGLNIHLIADKHPIATWIVVAFTSIGLIPVSRTYSLDKIVPVQRVDSYLFLFLKYINAPSESYPLVI